MTAVIAKGADGYVKYVGTKAVVLATGDISGDPEMIEAYGDKLGLKPAVNAYTPQGANTGDGQKMGLWIGAAWQHAPAAPMYQGGWGGGHEPCGFHWGLNVNTRTERYQREDVSAPYTAHYLLSQPDNIAYGNWTKNYPQAIIDRGQEWFCLLYTSDAADD